MDPPPSTAGPAETNGAVAQLGERLDGIQKVEGSTPFGSTNTKHADAMPCVPSRVGKCGSKPEAKPADCRLSSFRKLLSPRNLRHIPPSLSSLHPSHSPPPPPLRTLHTLQTFLPLPLAPPPTHHSSLITHHFRPSPNSSPITHHSSLLPRRPQSLAPSPSFPPPRLLPPPGIHRPVKVT